MCTMFFLVLVFYLASKPLIKVLKAYQAAATRFQNPDLWQREQQLRLLEERELRLRKENNMRQAMGIGTTLLRIFLQR